MSAELNIIDAVTLVSAGAIQTASGSPYSAFSSTSVNGVFTQRTYTIPKGSVKTIYDYDANDELGGNWTMCRIVASAACDLAWKGDKATSASDLTPLGTHETWNTKGLCAYMPEYLLDDVIVNATPADHCTDPGPLQHANAERGRIYEMEVENPDADNAMTVEVLFIN